MKKTYYIQDKRQYVGNSLLWWRPCGAGYTTDPSQAGLYNEDELSQFTRDTDIPWPSDYIDGKTRLHVDCQYVDRSECS